MKAELISVMGTDLAVVNAARVSFAKESEWEGRTVETGVGDKGWGWELVLKEDDAKLIRYLAKHDHWTPFAHTAVSLRMSAPVPIRTQCFKHKQGLVENEESRRYISDDPVFFIPHEFRSKPKGSVKQGSAGVHPHSKTWRLRYAMLCNDAIATYKLMIDDGVCPEQARFILPQGVEVNWVWTGNLYAFANFFNKRTDPHAQLEVQDLAQQVGAIIEPLFPVSWKALTNG